MRGRTSSPIRGWHLRSGSVYNGGGAVVADNKPGLVRRRRADLDRRPRVSRAPRRHESPDPRPQLSQRIRDRARLLRQPLHRRQRRRRQRRVSHIVGDGGGNYGFFSNDGSRDWTEDRRPGQNVWRSEWRQDDPGVVPAGCQNGSGGPTGVANYEASLIPDSRGRCSTATRGEMWCMPTALWRSAPESRSRREAHRVAPRNQRSEGALVPPERCVRRPRRLGLRRRLVGSGRRRPRRRRQRMLRTDP